MDECCCKWVGGWDGMRWTDLWLGWGIEHLPLLIITSDETSRFLAQVRLGCLLVDPSTLAPPHHPPPFHRYVSIFSLCVFFDVRWLLPLLPILLSIAFLLLSALLPESPVWLIRLDHHHVTKKKYFSRPWSTPFPFNIYHWSTLASCD